MMQTGAVDAAKILTTQEELISAIEAYEKFDQREEGWLKVELTPAGVAVG